jgi:hypothetical protein
MAYTLLIQNRINIARASVHARVQVVSQMNRRAEKLKVISYLVTALRVKTSKQMDCMMDITYTAIISYQSVGGHYIACPRLSLSIMISMPITVNYTWIWLLQVSLKFNVPRFIIPFFVAIIKVLPSTQWKLQETGKLRD